MRTYFVLPANGRSEITIEAIDFEVDFEKRRVIFIGNMGEEETRNVAIFNFDNIVGFFELRKEERGGE